MLSQAPPLSPRLVGKLMRHLSSSVLLACTLAGSAAQAAVYVSSDHTVPGGNAWNSAFGSQQNVHVGQASGGGLVSGVDLDIVAGAALNGDLYARSDSRTAIYGGSFTHYANGYRTSLRLYDSAHVKVAYDKASLGIANVDDHSSLTLENGRVDGIQVHDSGTARVSGGVIQSLSSFTIAEAAGIGAHLELTGGRTNGIVRATQGGSVDVSGGNFSTLFSYNGLIEVSGGLGATNGRLGSSKGGLGQFVLYGSNFALSNARADSYFDPTYWISGPGVSYVLTGTLLNGQTIRASYFEEGLVLGEAPRNIAFAASPVPEPTTASLMLMGLALAAWMACKGRQRV
ncbi:PEP-CTERM sorting domain-containing protein [Roseateles sp. LYH14W]|uniref:PEP-CTERM sorting domain-containing protein n=1 Tax=Pelomonas parva TaxID=3299032 RepID=A0ABW7EXX4_9BURK